ncbi:hypothetical protein [Chryseolinea serpens]|uniref:hypothetical protein n=1 Tax=Chryseolinea serpens TaxID=947013 RepID=UPI0015BE60FF|nr:hypothetical protein [Chryseolinea serpens]
MADFLTNEAAEGHQKLMFRKEEEVLLRACFRVCVINPENTLNDQAQIVTNHVLHIEEVTLGDLPWFPERPAASISLRVSAAKLERCASNTSKLSLIFIVFQATGKAGLGGYPHHFRAGLG